MERYFTQPYRFVPPYRSTFWYMLSRGYVTRTLRKEHGVTQLHVEGLDHLRESLSRQAGILLTPNHCRGADPMAVGLMAGQLRQAVYFLASSHLFRQGRLRAWLLRRLGSFSIWREGPDREAIKESARILASAERPLVLFPEGTWFRRNDEVMPLQEGLTLIARQAAKQSSRPLVVHPVGLAYWALRDPTTAVEARLAALERRLGWAVQSADVVTRLERLGSAFLAVREIEFLGKPRDGSIDERLAFLVACLTERLERQYLGRCYEGWALERIRRVRQHLTRQLLESSARERREAIRRDLDVLLLAENLNAHSLGYLTTRPTHERLIETVQRIEETLLDIEPPPVVPLGVSVGVGPALDLRASSWEMERLREAIQQQVNRLRQMGPPPKWNCPAPVPLTLAHEQPASTKSANSALAEALPSS
ncbi:MAG: 1-acyl-sn-glycerol-3-phosphate acyltransferase [Gemmataceae bacterium]